MLIFLQKKNADISKIKGVLEVQGIFSETTYMCVLTNFQISNIILSSFKQGGMGVVIPPKKTLKSPP